MQANFVKHGDGQLLQYKVVCHEYEHLAALFILESNVPQLFGIMFPGVKHLEQHGLISHDTVTFVSRLRLDALRIHGGLNSINKEFTCLMQCEDMGEI